MNLLKEPITGTIGTTKYKCTINWRNGVLIMDEPPEIEGLDTGPDPYTILLASLAGCTLSTLRMYIDRKGWTIREIGVTLNMSQENTTQLITSIQRNISFQDNVNQDQKERLLYIAEKCPVSKILKNTVIIKTTI
jgi:putative redox protein